MSLADAMAHAKLDPGRRSPRSRRPGVGCATRPRGIMNVAVDRTPYPSGHSTRGCSATDPGPGGSPRVARATYAASITTSCPSISGASNEIWSSSRSITVCSRRAPMFSVRSFTARRDARDLARSRRRVKTSFTPSVASSAGTGGSARSRGSVRMRTKSASVSGVELDADREAALELGDQVRRLRDVERAGGDEQDVVRAHRAVLGGHRRALDDRQQVALHALARHVGTVRGPRARRSCRSRR